MRRENSLEILRKCSDMLSKMTQEQFHELEKQKGLVGKVYDSSKYNDYGMDITSYNINDYVHKMTIELSESMQYDLSTIGKTHSFYLSQCQDFTCKKNVQAKESLDSYSIAA